MVCKKEKNDSSGNNFNEQSKTDKHMSTDETPTSYQMVPKLQNLSLINRKASKNSYLLIKGTKCFWS